MTIRALSFTARGFQGSEKRFADIFAREAQVIHMSIVVPLLLLPNVPCRKALSSFSIPTISCLFLCTIRPRGPPSHRPKYHAQWPSLRRLRYQRWCRVRVKALNHRLNSDNELMSTSSCSRVSTNPHRGQPLAAPRLAWTTIPEEAKCPWPSVA